MPALAGLLAGGEEAERTARRLAGDARRADDDEPAAADRAAIRLGADLHDGGWWWEAHEAWEVPWKRWDRLEPRARLLQALVQDAAAFLQRERGREAGVARLRRRAAANRAAALAAAPARATWLGLDHANRERAMAAWAAGRTGGPDAFPRLPTGFGEQR